jgi:hypothetical protein
MNNGLKVNKKKKSKKIVIYFFLLALLVITIWVLLPKKMYIKLGDEHNNYRVAIPDRIVFNKDCKALKEWGSKQGIPQIGLATETACPWRKKSVTKYSNFIMNGVKIRVPKEELVFQEEDGEQQAIYIELYYPEMKKRPGAPDTLINEDCKEKGKEKWKVPNPDTINITIEHYYYKECVREGICGKYSCKTNEICDPGIRSFRLFTGIYEKSDIEKNDIEFVLIKKNSKYGTDIYRKKELILQYPSTMWKKEYSGLHYHIKGDNPFEPEYWMHSHYDYDDPCSNFYVKSGFGFANNKLMVEYRFKQYKNVAKHYEIRKAIEKKLNSYIIK